MPVLLFTIIFMWTPPHFWALALFVKTDYAKVGIPMMPVVAGERSTRRQMLVYSILLLPITLLPWWVGDTGALYGISAALLSGAFLIFAIASGCVSGRVRRTAWSPKSRCSPFRSSIFSRCSARWWRIAGWCCRVMH
jgi:heme O synthase-like polyprenyltransferase